MPQNSNTEILQLIKKEKYFYYKRWGYIIQN